MENEPDARSFLELSDEELVRLSGLQRLATSHQDSEIGYQAAGELTRRLMAELRDTRLQAAASASKLERYTVWLVVFTCVLVPLGAISILVTLAA